MFKYIINAIITVPLMLTIYKTTSFTFTRSFYLSIIILVFIDAFGGFRQIPHYPKNIASFVKRRIIRHKIKLRKGRV